MTTSNSASNSEPPPTATPAQRDPITPTWIGLMIGNSRLHWGAFVGDRLCGHWHSAHRQTPLPDDARTWGAPTELSLQADLPLVLASVHPQQRDYAIDRSIQELCLRDIPIPGLYDSLGIDRALGLYQAGRCHGWPVLVIDGGTALTVTATNDQGRFLGGAILPGLRLQLDSLGQTGQLPQLKEIHREQPARWATSTEDAIASGLYYGLRAILSSYCEAWIADYPAAPIVLTGGDGRLLQAILNQRSARLHPHLVVEGLGRVATGEQEPAAALERRIGAARSEPE